MKHFRKILSILLIATTGICAAVTFGSSEQKAKSDPFAEIDRIFELQMQQMDMMRRQMNQLFMNFGQSYQFPVSGRLPAAVMNQNGVEYSGFSDKGDHYEFKIKIEDIDNSKVDISTTDNIITIKVSGSSKSEKTDKKYGKIISYTNRSSVQSFSIPQDADPESIKAEKDKNIITVTVKKKKSNTKHIRIRKKR